MSDKTFQHWKIDIDGDGIAWLHLDQAGAGANVLCVGVIEELGVILDEQIAHKPVGMVILSAKKNGFIAGADIKEFTHITTRDMAVRHIERGQAILDRIEALPFPTLALIHGFCMGGGLELALACTYRIADDGTETRLGLPEVQLGIHPGFGGTMRLTRLIGGPAAMDIMLTGRTLSARAAAKIGVIDYAVPTRQLHTAARQILLDRPAPHKASVSQRLTNSAVARRVLAGMMRKKVAQKARPDHYPAPYALIDLWQRHGSDPRGMLKAEAQSVGGLVVTPTARNLVRVFFLKEKLKGLGKLPADANARDVRHVHVIGAGVMGGDIAAWCAARGLTVTVQDRKPETLVKALQRARGMFDKTLKDKRLVDAAMDRLMPDLNGVGVPRADVIIEAIVENIEAKQALFRSLESRAKADALLTTNTSSIPLEVIGQALARPERLVGLHFFNPVAKMPLIEIVTARNTDGLLAQRTAAFARRIDRLPLPVKSSPGFLVNRILMPYLLEAVVVHEEKKPARAIDEAALAFGMPMGPLHLADTVGLDICLHVAEILAKQLNVPVPQSLRDMVTAGKLGVKSGEGFYRYAKGQQLGGEGTVNDTTRRDITDRLIARLLNEAVACLRQGVVAEADLLDAGIIFGTGFAPFRGGPLHYAASLGINSYVDKLHDLEHRHGEGFKADEGWGALVV